MVIRRTLVLLLFLSSFLLGQAISPFDFYTISESAGGGAPVIVPPDPIDPSTIEVASRSVAVAAGDNTRIASGYWYDFWDRSAFAPGFDGTNGTAQGTETSVAGLIPIMNASVALISFDWTMLRSETSGFTIVHAVRANTAIDQYAWGWYSLASRSAWVQLNDADKSIDFRMADGAGHTATPVIGTAGSYSVGSWVVYALKYDPVNDDVTTYVSGTKTVTDLGTWTPSSSWLNSPGTGVGINYRGGSTRSTCSTGDFYSWKTQLSDADINGICSYVASRFGLTWSAAE